MLQRHAITGFIGLSLVLHLLLAWHFFPTNNLTAQPLGARSLSLRLQSGEPAPPPVATTANSSRPSARPASQAIIEKSLKSSKTTAQTSTAASQATRTESQAREPNVTPPAEAAATSVASTQDISRSSPDKAQAPDLHNSNTINQERITKQLQLAIARHLEYPNVARRRGWEGIVVLGLRLKPGSAIPQLTLIKTSGYPLLDRAASESVIRIARLPEISRWLAVDKLDIVLPVEYRLIDS